MADAGNGSGRQMFSEQLGGTPHASLRVESRRDLSCEAAAGDSVGTSVESSEFALSTVELRGGALNEGSVRKQKLSHDKLKFR